VTELRLLVFGTEPGPQGSKRHVGNGRLIEASKKVAPWRAAVADAVAKAWVDYEQFVVYDDAVEIEITFYLPRPASVKRPLPIKPPDIDKLARSTLDGLVQGGALVDDALVTDLTVRKRYADATDTGAQIDIRPFKIAALF
jgi:crossover junction endodeoxyribonuclease RusA